MNDIDSVRSVAPLVRILAFLLEQKVSTTVQIADYCTPEYKRRYVLCLLKSLIEAGLVSSKIISMDKASPVRIMSLTKAGLEELKLQSGLELDKVQIKSNYPLHDIQLASIRAQFGRIKECDVFLTENVLQSRILEDDIPDLTLFRAQRVDAVTRIIIGNRPIWTPVELERGHKGKLRYKERIKRIYQSDFLKAVLFICETPSLKEGLVQLEKDIYPNQKRRLLFCDLPTFLKSNSRIRFSTSDNDNLDLQIGPSLRSFYPILDQSFTHSIS